jgi:hypothetical protein
MIVTKSVCIESVILSIECHLVTSNEVIENRDVICSTDAQSHRSSLVNLCSTRSTQDADNDR